MSKLTPGPLLKELDDLHQDIKKRIEKASFLSKNMTDKFVPIDDILFFVGKVVLEVEQQGKENKFLKEELSKVNAELALQNTVLLKIPEAREALEAIKSGNETD